MLVWLSDFEEYPALQANAVHLKHGFIDTNFSMDDIQSVLIPAEISRAQKFIKLSDQKKFLYVRAMMRKTLSHYLRVDPQAIELEVGEHGKPFVKNHTIEFNVSHSGGYFLLGITKDRAIGVDIEHVRKNQDCLALAERFFSPSEFSAIQTAKEVDAAFYRCWTRKEAFIKATGLGLSFGLANFEVSVSELPPDVSALNSIHHDVQAAQKWLMQSVSLGNLDEYHAAFCVQK